MWIYYRDNKALLPKWIREFREDIIEKLIRGDEADEASDVFQDIISNV